MSLRCLISSGPTREFFDPVRFLSNPSSGKMGHAIAAAGAERGWEVTLVSGPVSLPDPAGVETRHVVTAAEMHQAIDDAFPACDLLIMTAAISDWRPIERLPRKLPKAETSLTITLEPTVDILTSLAKVRRPAQYLVGFAAQTHDMEALARSKMERKGCDAIVANLVAGEQNAFGSDHNDLLLLTSSGLREPLGQGTKKALAATLVARLEELSHLHRQNTLPA